jgi:hypothetical protein
MNTDFHFGFGDGIYAGTPPLSRPREALHPRPARTGRARPLCSERLSKDLPGKSEGQWVPDVAQRCLLNRQPAGVRLSFLLLLPIFPLNTALAKAGPTSGKATIRWQSAAPLRCAWGASLQLYAEQSNFRLLRLPVNAVDDELEN